MDIDAVREGLLDLMDAGTYPWQWFVTMNCKSRFYVNAERPLKKWHVEVSKLFRVQLAYMGVFNDLVNPHIHLLVLGTNRNHNTLHDYGEDLAEKVWSDLMHLDCVIEPIYDIGGASRYIAHANVSDGHFEVVGPYKGKLLEKIRENPQDYWDDVNSPLPDSLRDVERRVLSKAARMRILISTIAR